ncbi:MULTISPECIES: zinc ribbon domain-containing protein [Aequorivita]|uniref:Zinc ribbon domain-containing protein n=1 Tax=Aequorivita iocasae TaxID=2803865 RepID=A0ABX7DW41_9FLAO|nr:MULTISPECIES: zinc ribbon domain-containing protein [Aequorivita]QQX77798.1 zinc ribbon domain-containing protein [Aequorivita iocasae]UCA57298.1 zinc ribbon domain-containing protein [Aequorivita sp. F7]
MEDLLIASKICSQCNSEIELDQKYCNDCGYPEGGTTQEQSGFHARQVMKKRGQAEASSLIKKGRNSLFVVAAIAFLSGLYYFFKLDDSSVLIVNSILSISYLLLGFWSQKRPLVALILGLLVYLTTLVLNGLIEPETIYKGLLIKGFIIVYLSKGINSALQLRNA